MMLKMEDNNYYTLEDNEEKNQPKTTAPFVLLLKLMFSPLAGWKAIARQNPSAEAVASGCFYPLTALVAALTFFSMVYDPTLQLSKVLVNAVVNFVALFLGYFVILFCIGIIVSKNECPGIGGNFFKVSVMMGLSTLAIFYCIYELLPMLEPLLFFTPLYTLYLMVRSVRFLKVSEQNTSFVSAKIGLILVLIPVALQYLFGLILPS